MQATKADFETAAKAWDTLQGEKDSADAKEAAEAGMKERKDADDTAKAAREGKVQAVNEWKDKFNTAVNGARKKYKIADLAALKLEVAAYETHKAASTGGITA